MKKIFFKNLSEMNEEENQTFVFDENLLGIKINNEQFVALSDIPRIFIDLEDNKKDVLFYFNKGVSEYVIFKSGKQGIIKCFEIKQEMQNGKTIIESINGILCIDNKNLLYNIINYNSAMIKRLLIEDLPIILEKLPFTSNEIEWYRNNISDIFNRKTLLDTTKENQAKEIVKYKSKKNNKLDFPLMFDGKKYSSLNALAREYNIHDDTLRMRIKKGMNLEEALTTPISNVGKRITNLKNMAIKIDNNQISIGDEM